VHILQQMAKLERAAPGLEQLLSAAARPSIALIAVVFVDPAIESCAKFCSQLNNTVDEVNGNAGETARLAVVLARESGDNAALSKLADSFTMTPLIVVDGALRHALSLSFVSSYPEMAVVDVS